MSEKFYMVATQILRTGKDCKFKPIRRCIPVETDIECQACVAEKLKLIEAVR